MFFLNLVHDYTLWFIGSTYYNVSYYNYNSIWSYYIVNHNTIYRVISSTENNCVQHMHMHGQLWQSPQQCVTPTLWGQCTESAILKLPSLFAAWLFWTFHTKPHNMKALIILSHSWSPFLPVICLYGKKWTFVGVCAVFCSIFLRKNSPQITHANQMTMTTSGQL